MALSQYYSGATLIQLNIARSYTEKKCECCGHVESIYARQISEGLLLFLHELTQEFWTKRTSQNYSDIQALVKRKYNKRSTDYTLLKSFMMIKPDEDKGAGWYKPTPLAYKFLNNGCSIPKYFYGDTSFSQEQVTVYDIMDNPPKPNWMKVL